MTKEKGEMEMGEGKQRKRKDFPPGIPQQKVSLLLFAQFKKLPGFVFRV